jgi:phospholipase C
MKSWSFALEAGSELDFHWPLQHFDQSIYCLDAYGPNGFYRGFKGKNDEPLVEFEIKYNIHNKSNPLLILEIKNQDSNIPLEFELQDQAYGKERKILKIGPLQKEILTIETGKNFGWYDYALKLTGFPDFERRFAGRIESGIPSKTDPQMGNISSSDENFNV